MVAIPFGTNAYRRQNGNMPEVRVRNMFAESAPTAEGQVVLLSRWGLLSSASRGNGPIHAVMWKEGVFGGDVFAVSGSSLYRGSALLGAISGTGPVSYAFSDTELVLTRGGSAYSYNGTNLAAIAFPDGADVRAVAFVAGLFVFVRSGTGKFYWSAVLNGRSVGALDFATAESSPDPIVDVQVMRGNLYLLGASTIEMWFPTGALDLPFTRVDQRLYPVGAAETGCALEMDNTLYLVGDDGLLYRLGDVPERVSDHALEERIQGSSSVSLWGFEYEGHKFVCVRLDSETFAYDVATRQIAEFASYGRDNFRAQCAVTMGTRVLLGDDETGTLWTFTEAAEDDGGTLERIFTAGFNIKGGTATVDNIQIAANAGWTEYLAGQGSDPQVEMRSSRDFGATWGNYRSAPLGQQGQYRTRTVWRRCGMFDAPGAVFEFRLTDPAPLRVSGVTVNEPGGGRSR